MCHRSRLWQPTVVRRSPFSRGSAESQRAVPKKNIECVCMVPCPVFPPPPWDWSPGSTPFPCICKLLPTFLFARSLQHFWLPASHLLGTCYLLDNLRSTHTPSKYLRATYSYNYKYMCYVSTSFSLHIRIYIHKDLYIHYIYIYIYIQIYKYIYTYIYIYIYT